MRLGKGCAVTLNPFSRSKVKVIAEFLKNTGTYPDYTNFTHKVLLVKEFAVTLNQVFRSRAKVISDHAKYPGHKYLSLSPI